MGQGEVAVTDDTKEAKRAAFIEANRWNLAKLHRDRSDFAANIFRGALFSAATAGMGFIAYGRTGADLRAHVVPLLLLGIGWGLTLLSWDIQKGKAVRKYDALHDGDIIDYDKPRPVPSGPNSDIARLSHWVENLTK